jgi:hypothetical protein
VDNGVTKIYNPSVDVEVSALNIPVHPKEDFREAIPDISRVLVDFVEFVSPGCSVPKECCRSLVPVMSVKTWYIGTGTRRT